jgi:hypothetical protein
MPNTPKEEKRTEEMKRLGAQAWNKMYHQLIRYKEQYGAAHCPIKKGQKDATLKKLATWCATQRYNLKWGWLPKEREELLNLIDFKWRKEKE